MFRSLFGRRSRGNDEVVETPDTSISSSTDEYLVVDRTGQVQSTLYPSLDPSFSPRPLPYPVTLPYSINNAQMISPTATVKDSDGESQSCDKHMLAGVPWQLSSSLTADGQKEQLTQLLAASHKIINDNQIHLYNYDFKLEISLCR